MKKRLRPEQWVVIRLALVAAFAEAAYAVINALALPVFVRRELHAAYYLGPIVGAFLLAEALLKGPMGILSDRVGRRVVLILAPLGSALAAVALTFVRAPFSMQKLAYMMGVRCLDGVAAAALWTTMYAAVADQVPEERRASAMSTLTVSYLAGFAMGPALGGWADKEYSVRAPFFLVAALFGLTSLAALFLVPRQPPQHASHTEHEDSVSLAGFVESLRRAPQYMAIAMAVFLAVGLLIPITQYLAQDEFGLDPEEYGKLFVLPAVVIGLLTVPIGRLGDRWGAPRSVHIGMATAALALWAMALLPKTEVLLVIGASALGIGFVVGLPAWMAIISGLADPQHRGAMIGAVATAQGLGAFAGVLVGPMLYNSDELADRLNVLWPGHSLSSDLLPVIGAAILLSATWLASLLVVRGRRQVSREA
jgi:DHA1 family multidrug resistance protein-like MFS transporter